MKKKSFFVKVLQNLERNRLCNFSNFSCFNWMKEIDKEVINVQFLRLFCNFPQFREMERQRAKKWPLFCVLCRLFFKTSQEKESENDYHFAIIIIITYESGSFRNYLTFLPIICTVGTYFFPTTWNTVKPELEAALLFNFDEILAQNLLSKNYVLLRLLFEGGYY